MDPLGLLTRVAAVAIAATVLGGALVLVAGLASVPRLAVPATGVVGVVSGVVFCLYLSGRAGARRSDTVYW
jgi:hypothetical protein